MSTHREKRYHNNISVLDINITKYRGALQSKHMPLAYFRLHCTKPLHTVCPPTVDMVPTRYQSFIDKGRSAKSCVSIATFLLSFAETTFDALLLVAILGNSHSKGWYYLYRSLNQNIVVDRGGNVRSLCRARPWRYLNDISQHNVKVSTWHFYMTNRMSPFKNW